MTDPSFDRAMFDLLHEHKGVDTFGDMAFALGLAGARYLAMHATGHPVEARGIAETMINAIQQSTNWKDHGL